MKPAPKKQLSPHPFFTQIETLKRGKGYFHSWKRPDGHIPTREKEIIRQHRNNNVIGETPKPSHVLKDCVIYDKRERQVLYLLLQCFSKKQY